LRHEANGRTGVSRASPIPSPVGLLPRWGGGPRLGTQSDSWKGFHAPGGLAISWQGTSRKHLPPLLAEGQRSANGCSTGVCGADNLFFDADDKPGSGRISIGWNCGARDLDVAFKLVGAGDDGPSSGEWSGEAGISAALRRTPLFAHGVVATPSKKRGQPVPGRWALLRSHLFRSPQCCRGTLSPTALVNCCMALIGGGAFAILEDTRRVSVTAE